MKKRTNAWQAMRKVHLMTYPECRVCGCEDDVAVHHLRYRGKIRGLTEQPGDLMTLCATHHNDLHRTYNGGSLVVHTLAYVRAMAS